MRCHAACSATGMMSSWRSMAARAWPWPTPNCPDLILMDLNLPDVDGWEATQMLKGAPETRTIPIMAMTAHAIAGDQERALQAGCDDYHAKPVEFPRLLTQIEALLTGTPRR